MKNKKLKQFIAALMVISVIEVGIPVTLNLNTSKVYADTLTNGQLPAGDKDIVSISIISPHTDRVGVANGTDLSLVQSTALPKTVCVTLRDNTTCNVDVASWDNGTSQADGSQYNEYIGGDYTFKGTLSLSTGISNPNNLQAIVIITVGFPGGQISETTPASVIIAGPEKVGGMLSPYFYDHNHNQCTTNSAMTYQWYRLNNKNDEFSNVIGNNKYYTLTDADAGKYIGLIVDYDDTKLSAHLTQPILAKTPQYISSDDDDDMPTPVQENVTVPVEIGTGEKKSTININALRALDTDGLEKGTLKLDEDTSKKIAANAVEAKSNEADLVLPTDAQYSNDKMDIQLPKESITEFSSSNIFLNIEKGNAALELLSQTLADLKDKDAEIKIKQLTDSSMLAETKSLILQLISGGQSVSTPVSIETNFSGRAKITLPIDVSKFTSKEDLNKYLSSLAVVVQHSDGENVVDKGTIKYDANGNPIGISIWVNKFSDFTLVQLPEDYFKGRTTVMKDKVEADKEWHIKFAKAVDPATVKPENIYVTDSKGNKVDVKVSCESNDVIKVSPANPYKSGESYYIYVSKKVTSIFKGPLTEDLRYEFTVK